MRRRLWIAVFSVLSIITLAGGTLALFTAADTSTNVITAGNIRIKLVEMMVGEDEELLPFEEGGIIMPGGYYSKIVTVKNTGDHPAYVRVKVKKATRPEAAKETKDPFISLDFNTEDWAEDKGYYYYKKELPPGEETEALFTTVSLSKDAGNEYQDCMIEIGITAEGTQSENNGTDVFSADGWPGTE